MLTCFFCKRKGADTTVDYCTATGRKTLPGLNSRNFDSRYGYPAHSACLEGRLKRIAKKASKQK